MLLVQTVRKIVNYSVDLLSCSAVQYSEILFNRELSRLTPYVAYESKYAVHIPPSLHPSLPRLCLFFLLHFVRLNLLPHRDDGAELDRETTLNPSQH